MASGTTYYSAISAIVNDIIEDSLAVARMANVLLDTITNMSATGMLVRKVHEYNALSFNLVGEDDDTSPQKFEKDELATLTPLIYRASLELTDARLASDWDSEIANAAQELGSAAAKHVDVAIAGNYSSLTGGTIGSGNGSTITWRFISAAQSVLVNNNVPAGSPIFCVLHPFQWEPLIAAVTPAGASVAVAPQFTDRMVNIPNYFTVPRYQGIIFVITNSITITGGASPAAIGGMHVPQALAVDTRKSFDIRPERDESRELTELNSSMWYDTGVWRPVFGIALNTDAATPDGS